MIPYTPVVEDTEPEYETKSLTYQGSGSSDFGFTGIGSPVTSP